MTFKPMLSPGNDPMSYPNYFKELKFPLLVSPKLDGIRCIVKGGRCKSRSFKDIPNEMIQERFGEFAEFDGELIDGNPTDENVYNRTQSTVMSKDKDASKVKLYVFDYAYEDMADLPFEERLLTTQTIVSRLRTNLLVSVPHYRIDTLEDLLQVELSFLNDGYEGIMMRCPYGRYKHGRGTWNEGLIYKLKRFQDDEAIIVDFVEMMHNTNEGVRNELGYIERSDTKDAKEGSGMVGKFICEFNGELIEVAAGQFSHDERKLIWNQKEQLVGAFIKFRHFTIGVKDKPRFPRAVGFRDKMDM